MELDIFIDEGAQINLGARNAMTMACVVVPEQKRRIYTQASDFLTNHGSEWKWRYATQQHAEDILGVLESERIRAGFLQSPGDRTQAEQFQRDFEAYQGYLARVAPSSPIPGVQNFLRMRMTAWIMYMGLRYVGVEYQEVNLPIILLDGYRVPVRVNFFVDDCSYTETEKDLIRSGITEFAARYHQGDRQGNYPNLQPEIGELRFTSERETPGMVYPDYICGMMTMEAIPAYRHRNLTGVVNPSSYAQRIRERLPGPFYTANEYPALRLPPEARANS